jgi:hypothetical protein
VNDSPIVSNLNCASQRLDDCGRLAGWLRHSRQRLGKAASFKEFHRKVWLSVEVAYVKDLYKVCVSQGSHCFGFALKPHQFLIPRVRADEQHLQSDRPVELPMTCTVNHTHAAITEKLLYVVSVNLRARFAELLLPN